jgi:hypothetical protein
VTLRTAHAMHSKATRDPGVATRVATANESRAHGVSAAQHTLDRASVVPSHC